MKHVVIIGGGLIGASLAHDCKKQGFDLHIVEPSQSAQTILNQHFKKLYHSISKLPQTILHSEQTLIMLCHPVNALPEVLSKIPQSPRGPLISDCLGIKAWVHQHVQASHPNARFVGGHPMSGGPKGGASAARPGLFANAAVAITSDDASTEDIQIIKKFWSVLGANVLEMAADEHDRAVSATSHLPYALSIATAQVLSQYPTSPLAGRGLEASIRQAQFAPEIMTAVIQKNPYLVPLLKDIRNTVDTLVAALESGDDRIQDIAKEAQSFHLELEAQML